MAGGVGSEVIRINNGVFGELTIDFIGKRVRASFVRKLGVVPGSGCSVVPSILRFLFTDVSVGSLDRSGLALTAVAQLVHHVPSEAAV